MLRSLTLNIPVFVGGSRTPALRRPVSPFLTRPAPSGA